MRVFLSFVGLDRWLMLIEQLDFLGQGFVSGFRNTFFCQVNVDPILETLNEADLRNCPPAVGANAVLALDFFH